MATNPALELTIDRLTISDPTVVDLLVRHSEDEREGLLLDLLSIGARGLQSMGLSLGLDDIDNTIQRSVSTATATARQELVATLETIVERAHRQLDPAHLDSPAARTLTQLEQWRSEMAATLDPDHPNSNPGRLLEMLEKTIGINGELELRLRALLDPAGDDSAVASLAAMLTSRFNEVRALILEDRGRRQEAERGTRKGFGFEETLETALRAAAAPHGWLVERTGAVSGSLHADSKVGDFVVELGDDHRVVIEAKKTARVGLTGADGILAELDRAMANRGADYAICVSAEDAFPGEVGLFNVYGNRALVVDDGDGSMLGVALRWARMALTAQDERGSRTELDWELIADRLQRLRNLAKRFSGTKRSLTQISASVDDVRQNLDALRLEVIDQLNDLEGHLLERPSNVVQLAPVESL